MIGLEGSGFIISIGVSLLLTGLIIYYVNTKFAAFESALVQQNKVLGNFITGVKQELSTRQFSETQPEINESLANPVALDAARKFTESPIELINVSDNSDSESESDDDDDEGADEEVADEEVADEEDSGEEGADEEDSEEEDSGEEDSGEEDSVEEVHVVAEDSNNDVKVIELVDDNSESSESEDSDEEEEEVVPESDVNVVQLGVDKVAEQEATPHLTIEDYKNRKVTELRKMVTEKKLAKASNAKALKKDELIELLNS